MLPHLLGALDLRCNNTAYRPVMDAVELLRRYADRRTRFYDPAERVPLDDVVRRDWRDAVVDERGQVERVQLVQSLADFYDGGLVEAARGWRFEPARRAGRPVKYRKLIEITMRPE